MLRSLTPPSLSLLLLSAIFAANTVTNGFNGEYPAPEINFLYHFSFTLLLMWWVYVDRRIRNRAAPFEFEAFVFFAWIVVVPYYLIQTRRWRGLALIGVLYATYLFPYAVGIALFGF